MAPSSSFESPRSGVERVRHELLTALHFGKLTPGDRVPSVRRLADMTGMNRKTVHRAYTRLAEEGLLDLRPGSGTFVADHIEGPGRSASLGELQVALNRCRAAAEELGLTPALFARFVDIALRTGFRDLQLTVVECNNEQLGLLDADLRRSLGIATRPVLLPAFRSNPEVAHGTHGVLTTACHSSEVAEMTRGLGLPVYRVALDPAFPEYLVDLAQRSPVCLLVRDRQFAPVFARLLRQMGVPPRVIGRFRVVELPQVRAALQEMTADTVLYVSPLVESAVANLPTRWRRVRGRWRIEPGSLERLKASLALDLAAVGSNGTGESGS